MILRDRVTTVARVLAGYDDYGNPFYADVESDPIPAELHPLGSEEALSADRTVVITRFRVVVGPKVTISPSSAIRWRGTTYEVNGDIEPHTAGGRLRHHEFTIRRAA